MSVGFGRIECLFDNLSGSLPNDGMMLRTLSLVVDVTGLFRSH